MKMRKYRFTAIVLLCVTLCGCRQATDMSKPLCTVVTKVSVSYENGPFHAQREYTDTEKTRQILNYIRQLDPYGKPEENPQNVSGSEYRIDVYYSDGTCSIYRQKCDRYFQNADGIWYSIKPERAKGLGLLLGKIRSDDSTP